MKIGLDFDGVISDNGRLKSEGARKLYGIDISPDKFKRELVVGAGILTSDEYTELQKQIYENPEIGLKMLYPVSGALEYIQRLQKEGHDITIISSRGVEKKLQIAKEWIKINGLTLNIIGVGLDVNKANSCKGLDVYIDDDLDKLEPLVEIVQNRYLFSWGYNKHIEVPPSIAKRIESWGQFYEEIHRLNNRS